MATQNDNAITDGKSIAKSVIHGLICTEPKQPQEAKPETALYNVTTEKNEKQSKLANLLRRSVYAKVSHAAFLNSPDTSQIPRLIKNKNAKDS